MAGGMTQTGARRKLRRAARCARRALGDLPPVLFLTDPQRTPDLLDIAQALPSGWGVIYRHFGAPEAEAMARALIATGRRRGICVLLTDAAMAARLGADGVHWPERHAAQSRRWTGRFRLMTASAHSRQALARAAALPVDAVLVSTVFASASPSASAPRGALRLRLMARGAACPVYGLGGIDAGNAGRIACHAGLAMIGGIADAFRI